MKFIALMIGAPILIHELFSPDILNSTDRIKGLRSKNLSGMLRTLLLVGNIG